MRKSFDAVDSLWSQLRYDGMNKVLAVVYLCLCGLFLNMKLANSSRGDGQMSWILALLPELMLLGAAALGLLGRAIDLVLPLTPWPSMKAGQTHIMQQPSGFVRTLQFLLELPISILYVVIPFKGWFERMNESCVTRNLRERAAKRLLPVH